MANEAHKAIIAAKNDALFQAARDAMPQEVKKADLLAEVRRVHYNASIRRGFTPDEALLLCMNTKF